MTKHRNLEGTRCLILKMAFEEVYAKGFQGVSIDDIVRRTKLTKGAFYHHFPTKLDLGYALVDEVLKPMIVERWIKPLTAYKNPMNGILSQMRRHIGDSPEESLRFGCPLNNLVQEMAPVDKGFEVRLRAALDVWIDETEKHIKRAQLNGHIKKRVNTRNLAQFIVMAHEGFYGIMKGLGGKQSFNALYSSLKEYFDSISTKPSMKYT